MKLFLKGERCFKPSAELKNETFRPVSTDDRKAKIVGYGSSCAKSRRSSASTHPRESVPFLLRARRPAEGRYRREPVGLSSSALDNVLVRLGFATTHAQARQFVRHGHVVVNGKKVNIPSYQ